MNKSSKWQNLFKTDFLFLFKVIKNIIFFKKNVLTNFTQYNVYDIII